MRTSIFSFRAGLTLLVSAALLAPVAFAASTHRTTTSRTSSSHKLSHGRHKTVRRPRGQQAIDSDRVTQIQQALIHEHYLTGDPNGDWDSTTIAAMQKYQADHGWQTKLMPDSRALNSLGLGPDYSTALNASGSSFAAPSSSAAPPQNTGFVAASGVSQ
jgi:hypothetical protein